LSDLHFKIIKAEMENKQITVKQYTSSTQLMLTDS